jgi:hypothetical protein
MSRSLLAAAFLAAGTATAKAQSLIFPTPSNPRGATVEGYIHRNDAQPIARAFADTLSSAAMRAATPNVSRAPVSGPTGR